ncbi:hypothetical protein [Lactiplantibacillus daowaiensis]|uniref:Uncharacterized protein n=1 Tax=Lactiplantibacillus daowaiensis TaxID=2559918 RepID=A0ABW1RX50_9LACO|nr:hypothetical protein [Lactiplantibacillus daowaiensis]
MAKIINIDGDLRFGDSVLLAMELSKALASSAKSPNPLKVLTVDATKYNLMGAYTYRKSNLDKDRTDLARVFDSKNNAFGYAQLAALNIDQEEFDDDLTCIKTSII